MNLFYTLYLYFLSLLLLIIMIFFQAYPIVVDVIIEEEHLLE